MEASLPWHRRVPFFFRVAVIAAGVAVAIWAVFAYVGGGASIFDGRALYTVRRGDLTFSVVEGGSLAATRSVKILSEVEGQARIITIVPEGSFAKKGELLVELDSADLRDRVTQQEITFQNATSQYAQASSAYEIQLNQSESNVNAAQLKVRFARLDLEKYVGSDLAVKLDEKSTLQGEGIYEELGGEASQRLNKLKSDIALAQEEKSRAEDRLDSTERLAEAGYVTKTELRADELALTRSEIALEQAETALAIFRKYEFPRELEKLSSDYKEALRELARVKAKAESEDAKAGTTMLSAKSTLDLQTSKLEKIKDQLAKSRILAPQDGMVIYSSSTTSHRGSSGTLIEPGATVRYRQELINLPDTSSMQVDVNVAEAFIEKIRPGLQALVTVDAFPDRTTRGAVSKVALLPDSPMRWLNPDIKVYRTSVILEETWEGLKPGMSAEVEIIVARLRNVLQIPVQAVARRDGEMICWVVDGEEPLERRIEIGLASDDFVEVKSGLREDDRVLLAPPESFRAEKRREAPEGEVGETEEGQRGALEEGAPEEGIQGEEETGERGAGMRDRLPAEARERLKNLSPEERRELMEQRQGRRGRGGQ